MGSYSIQKHHGNWQVRWSVYKVVDGRRRRTQPTHIVGPDSLKKSDAESLAAAYFARAQRSRTVQAGSSLSQFVTNVFLPDCETRLSIGTTKIYRQQWKRLEPHLGSMRLRDVMTPHIQTALDGIHDERGDDISHDLYMLVKVTCSAIFSLAIRRGDHPGPNPENNTSVRGYGHKDHRENGAYDLNEIKQLLTIFPKGDVAVAIGINAFLALRKPEAETLTPEDFDKTTGLVRIHTDTKTGNDERLPVVAPLRNIMAGGWSKVNMRNAECWPSRMRRSAFTLASRAIPSTGRT
jgi:hypothetical protein